MALKFIPNPTFRLVVTVPVAGQDKGEEIPLIVKHMKPSEYAAVVKETVEKMVKAENDDETQIKTMVEALLKVITGWEWTDEGKPVDVPLSEENIATVIANYPAFYSSVVEQYGQELYKVREKN